MNTEKYLKGTILFLEKYGKTSKEKADVEILKQCLEERQALEIIVKKKVDMNVIVDYDCKSAKDYNSYMRLYRFDFIALKDKEFKLVLKVAKEITEEEKYEKK